MPQRERTLRRLSSNLASEVYPPCFSFIESQVGLWPWLQHQRKIITDKTTGFGVSVAEVFHGFKRSVHGTPAVV